MGDKLETALKDSQELLNPVFGTPEGQASGTTLGQNKYDFKYLTFPNDVGMDWMGHYMIININVPTSGFKLTNGLNVMPVAGKFGDYFTPLEGGDRQVSKVDVLRYSGGISDGTRTGISIPRQTRRIAESIALFMPGGLVFTDSNEYQNIEMSAYAGQLAAMGVGGIIGMATMGPVGGLAGAAAVGIADPTGGSIGAISQAMSNPINPAVEVLFSTRHLREFVFDFMFAPRNAIESNNLKGIIQTLRFHAAPEINTGATGLGIGATWIPPADFDISFFKHGAENTNLLRINTCVITRMDVDYNPTNLYSTFSNGHPVAVRVTIAFRELVPVAKNLVVSGF